MFLPVATRGITAHYSITRPAMLAGYSQQSCHRLHQNTMPSLIVQDCGLVGEAVCVGQTAEVSVHIESESCLPQSVFRCLRLRHDHGCRSLTQPTFRAGCEIHVTFLGSPHTTACDQPLDEVSIGPLQRGVYRATFEVKCLCLSSTRRHQLLISF
ncbi:MAG: hypothetical protein EOO40_06445 [Deltaproteobacteria bacterium]|nr:MAG: hypothetical protein EOO40_06445 [Deltaproteobacteria bacterium]